MLALRHAGSFAPSSGATFMPTALNPSGVKLLANVHRLGMGRTVSMSLDVPQVHLDRVRSITGRATEGVYHGWDRFGRLKQQVWALTPTPAPTTTGVSGQREFGWMQDTSSTPTYPEVRPVYQHAYSYSADSDRLSDDDLRPTYGGGSGSGAAVPDRKFSYDNLRRLTKEEKGKFTWSNGSQSFARGAGSKLWSLDMLGNWKSVAEDADGNGSFVAAETSIRTHDAQNQLTSLGATTAGGGTPEYVRAYDKNGNLVSETIEGDTKPVRKFIYDAWNRLVRVERGPGGSVEPSPVAAYSYNALNWRVTERVRWPGDPGSETSGYTRTRVFFFSSDWQVLNALEDRHADTPTTSAAISTFTPDSETQFMWGVRDKDELLQVRTRALTDANGVVYNPEKIWTDNGFVNTVYALTDAQMSVAGYVSASGRVRESRLYDSYGRMTRTLPGDLNGDGACDDADFAIFNTSYDLLDCSSPSMPGRNVAEGASPGNAPTWGCPADLNGDWVVDEVDFGIFAASYNQLVPDVDALVGGNASGGGIEWGPGWNGYWFDPATGLWLSRHRWYDPVGGRWITRDPAGYVDGLSLYLYVKGNPFLFRDPSGLWGIVDSWNAVTGAVNTAGNWVGTKVGDGVFNAAQAFGPAGQGAATAAAIAEGASAGATKGAIYVAAGAVAVAAAPEGIVATGVAVGLGALGTYGSYHAGVGINEAFTGEDASTGETLSVRDRAERATSGAIAVGTLGYAAVKAPKPVAKGEGASPPTTPEAPGAVPAKATQKFQGGAYEELGTNGGTLHRHHMPADSISPIRTSRGPAVQMTPTDHKLTSSYGNSKAAQNYRKMISETIRDKGMRKAMELEVRDVRRVGGTKYNRGLLEALRYGKQEGYIPQRCNR